MMKNKSELIQYAVVQVIEKGNVEALKTIFTTNYIAHAEGKVYKGHAFLKRFTKLFQNTFSDLAVVQVKILIEHNNLVTWQRTLQGIHKKNMMGIPASNNKIKWNEIAVSRFKNDKIVEEWVVSELLGQLLLNQSKVK